MPVSEVVSSWFFFPYKIKFFVKVFFIYTKCLIQNLPLGMSLAYRGAYKQKQFKKRMDIQHVQKNSILHSKLIIELFGHDAGDLVKFIK